MRAVVLSAFLAAAVPAGAAPSLCGHLPEAGKVAAAGPDEVQPPKPRPNRSLACPPGFTLDLMARPAVCHRAAQTTIEGNPRAACRASLTLGPVADVPAQYRPTRSCPSGPITALIRLEGTNVGLADVALSTISPGVTITALDEGSEGLDPAQAPWAQGCFAHQCRLVQMTVAADAIDAARLQLAIPDGERLVVTVPLTLHCADPTARPAPAGPRRTSPAAPPR